MLNRLTSLKVLILLICAVISLHLARCMSAPKVAQKDDFSKKSLVKAPTMLKR